MNVQFSGVFRRRFSQLVLCGAMLLPLGCGPSSDKIVGKVAGRVTFKGAPVSAGIVYLNSSQTGAGGSGNLNAEGEFTIAEPIEAGEYKVTVTPPLPPPPIAGQATPAPAKTVDIPKKYWTEGESDLKARIEEGENTLDFDLKP